MSSKQGASDALPRYSPAPRAQIPASAKSGHIRKRIGFLFNHDQLHQIAHSLPIALALADQHPDFDITLLSSTPMIRKEIQRLLAASKTTRISVDAARVSPQGWLQTGLDNVLPLGRVAFLRRNLAWFETLDALVVTEKTSLMLQSEPTLKRLKFIHTRHGAGDRAIGFNAQSGRFDFVLLSGRKIQNRLARSGLLKPDGAAIVGYPKFDMLAERLKDLPRFFDNGRPTVLYNPHLSPSLSSWYRMGPAIIDFFRQSKKYNLIFAPHVMLFQRRVVLTIDPIRLAFPGKPLRSGHHADNIFVDIGSPAASDMTYTLAADIYLGDASSQLYEFLLRPRPALFADAHRTFWQGNENYTHWNAGPVLTDVRALDWTLDHAINSFSYYEPIQKAMFAETFDLTEIPSATRAADAIAHYLEHCEG